MALRAARSLARLRLRAGLDDYLHLARPRRDFAPAGDSLSCSCKKGSKEHGPASAPQPAAGVPCDARSLGPAARTRCVRCAHSAQTSGPSQSLIAHCVRWPQPPALLSASEGQQPNSQQPGNGAIGSVRAVRYSAVGCCPYAGAEQHRNAGRRAARTPTLQARPNCLNGVSAANAVSFGPARRFAQRRGPGRRPGAGIGAVFFAYFLARARK